MEKKVSTPLTVGIILSLILIVLSIVIYLTGLYTQSWAQYLALAILVGGILFGIINYGKEKNNQVTFGNLFGFGFKVAAVATCLVIAYSLLSGIIFPEAKQKMIEIAREKALTNPNATQDQIDKGMEIFEKNYNLIIVIFILFWYLIIGAITSLIGAAIAKKNPPTPFDQQP